MKNIELKLEKNKSDKEIIDNEIKNNELRINENKKILELLKKKKKKIFLKAELLKHKEEEEKKENKSEIKDIENQVDMGSKESSYEQKKNNLSLFSECLLIDDDIEEENNEIMGDSKDNDFEFKDFIGNTFKLDDFDNDYLKNKFDKIY